MLSVELLEKMIPKDHPQLSVLDIAKRQGTQLSKLVDGLLDITRISQNKMVLNKERLEINKLVEDSAQDFKQQFLDKEIDLEVILSNPLYMEGDSCRINQVISNLLHNALKFSSKGDTVRVIVSQDTYNNEVVIIIQDTGRGIRSKDLDKLFSPFAQVDKTLDSSNGGLGLGLPLVKSLVELHGGKVTVDSEGLGKGSKFTVSLPLIETSIEIKEDSYEEPTISKPQKVLIIDDNKDLNNILVELINQLGHQAISAYSGKDGLAKAIEIKPDAIISDIGLPDISGHDLAKEITKMPELKHTNLIALSGYAQASDIDRSIEAGFDQHIGKPVDINTLIKTLEE